MKKLIVLAVCAFSLISCEIESDEPSWIPELAEVTAIDLPESFEQGKTYTIDVTYELPTACHMAQGLNASRESAYGSGRRKIFIAGVAAKKFGETTCDKESENLEKESSFKLLIDEDMTYTFFLWTGVDQTGKAIYTEVQVPVQDPDAADE